MTQTISSTNEQPDAAATLREVIAKQHVAVRVGAYEVATTMLRSIYSNYTLGRITAAEADELLLGAMSIVPVIGQSDLEHEAVQYAAAAFRDLYALYSTVLNKVLLGIE